MSEWFKEHDWKSCVGLKPTGGSNPLLCAKKNTPFEACFFVGAEKIERLSELTEVRASGVFFLAFSVQVVYNMYVIKEKGI